MEVGGVIEQIFTNAAVLARLEADLSERCPEHADRFREIASAGNESILDGVRITYAPEEQE